MWLIFCGACDNRPGGGRRRRKCERQWLKRKAWNTENLIYFNAFFVVRDAACGCRRWVQMREGRERGIKNVIKYSKRYSWKILLSYINYVCVVAIIFFSCLLAFYIARRQTCLLNFLPFYTHFHSPSTSSSSSPTIFHLVPKNKLE